MATNLDLIDDLMEGITLADGSAVVVIGVGSTNGTKIGGATTQKLGFWNATPVVRPSSANQAAVGTLATVALTDSTGGTPSTTLAAISDTATKNAIASLATRHANVLTDLGAIKTLANQLRSDLVTIGLVKGSA